MEEIEVKILEINRDEVEKKIVSLGAKKVFDGEIKDVYFDFENQSLHDSGKTVRLRQQGDESFITFKEKIRDSSAEVREENEVGVSDFEAIRAILTGLGLLRLMDLRKKRTTYKLKGANIELNKYMDKLAHIPDFLEIEADNEAKVFELAEELDFKKEDCKPWTFLELVEHYKK